MDGNGRLLTWSRVLALGAAVTVSAVTAAQAVTLEEAVRQAVNTNPDVRFLASERRAVDHELRQARAGYLPLFDIRAAAGPEWSDRPSVDDKWLLRTESQATVRQLLFDGFATASEVERQRARVGSAAQRVHDSAQTTALNAVLAYLEVLRSQSLVEIAEDNAKAHAASFADVKRLADAGRGNVGDVRQTEARLASARASLVRTQGRLADTEANYIRVVGSPPSNLVRPSFSDSAMPTSRDGAVALALRNNPAVAVAQADIDTAKAELKATNAPFMPRLDLELGTQQNNNIDGVVGREQDFTALVVLRYNLYAGGGDTARRKEFVERLAASRDRLDRAKRRVAEETRLAWNGRKTAAGRAARVGEEVAADEGVVDAYRQQFLIGQRDLLDLLDAQNELFISRGNLVTEETTALFGGYQVAASMGALLGALGVKKPKEGVASKSRKSAPAKKMAEKPKAEEAKPVAVKPAPKAEEAKPVAVKPAPKAEEAKPVAVKPAPKAEEAKPVAVKPAPKAEEAKPVAVKQTPKAEAAKPKAAETTKAMVTTPKAEAPKGIETQKKALAPASGGNGGAVTVGERAMSPIPVSSQITTESGQISPDYLRIKVPY
ncbi:MAG: TolC family outer membrane protein [Proteobacteria bacterium]|nr:TolC family outer membrane protein [Pseudomonadota bacterium]